MDSPIYAFYKDAVEIIYIKGRRVHRFSCAHPTCKHRVNRYLDTGDAMSTGNLTKHAKSCWSVEAVQAASALKSVKKAREHVEELGRTGLITEAFKRASAGGKRSYSTRPHTPMQSR